MKKYFIAAACLLCCWAQADTYTINWNKPDLNTCQDGSLIKTLTFENDLEISTSLKVGLYRIRLEGAVNQLKIINASYIKCLPAEDSILDKSLFLNQIHYELRTIISRFEVYTFVDILPIIKGKDGALYKVKNFELELTRNNLRVQNTDSTIVTQSSVLNKGDWYKVSVNKTGVFKIDYNYLKSMGIAVDGISPNSVQIYGFGGMLAEKNSDFRYNDLPEIAMKFIGNGDSKFDASEYFLAYLQGPDLLRYDNGYVYEKNIYSDQAFYFITHSQKDRKPLQSKQAFDTFDAQYNNYDFVYRHEQDEANFLPSGRLWVGESFVKYPTLGFNITIPELIKKGINIKGNIAGSNTQNTGCAISFNGKKTINYTLSAIPSGATNYTEVTFFDFSYFDTTSTSGSYSLNFQYNKASSDNKTYLDYFQIEANAKLNFTDNFLLFRNKAVSIGTLSKFNINTSKINFDIWDVSMIGQIMSLPINTTGGSSFFVDSSSSSSQYMAVDLSANFENPSFVTKVENQDLHGSVTPDLLIITHPSLRTAADKLAAFRHSHNGYNVLVANTDKIYNEFSSGAQDLSAIRDFIKYLYNQDKATLKWVVLFGACSYDYKDRISNNTNLVPIFETDNSENTVNSYSSDDFVGQLDPNEGGDIFGGLDVGIGRLPVRNLTEAGLLVDKLIYYSTSPLSYDKWKNNLSFVCDDGDDNTHLNASETLTQEVLKYNNAVKLNKLYLGLFPETSSPIGQASPTLTQKIVDEVEKGSFLLNYSGHGREIGWAAENLITLETIRDFRNKDKLFLLTAGTCEFGRYDAPEIISGVLEALYNNDGGAVATIAATRPVYASGNLDLNKYLIRYLFEKVNGTYRTLGEILRKTKDSFINDSNSKSYALLGDPSLILNYPTYDIKVDEIVDDNGNTSDTLKALSKITVKGSVRNDDSVIISDFNGEVTFTLYDKEFDKLIKYDPESDLPYSAADVQHNVKIRESIIYQGKAIVTGGKFSVSFIVPKDISYLVGNGLMLIYAKNDSSSLDASGGNMNFFIGDSDDNVPVDNNSPIVKLYINDTTFLNGGLTDKDIVFLAKISDESGINLSRTSVGHEISLVLDNQSSNSSVINDFYISEQNSFTRGSITYPMFNLSEGIHSLTLRIWDIFNNSTTETIYFEVKHKGGLAIGDLFSIPSPKEDFQTFKFSHNRAGEDLTAELQIFDMQGNKVRELNAYIPIASAMVSDVYWQTQVSNTEYSSSAGLYIYKLFLKSENDGSSDKKIQKVAFLK